MLAAVILCPLDHDPRRLIDRLGDEEPAVRDAAQQALAALGEPALPLLRDAAAHPDAEVRSRAAILLRRIDQAAYFKSLAIAQRAHKIRLMAVDFPPGPDRAATDGGLFRFERRPWIVEGEARGSVFHTLLTSHLQGEIEWTVASIRAGENLAVERCSAHSPAEVYVAEQAVAPYTVVIKGVRRWLCDVPVEFKEPAEGDRRRVGPYTLTLRWPGIEIQAEGGLPLSLTAQLLDSRLLRPRFRPGRERIPKELETPMDEPAIFFPEAKEEARPEAWCGCEKAPRQHTAPPWTSWRRQVALPVDPSCGFSDLSSLSLVFRLPVEEPFELESPPLK